MDRRHWQTALLTCTLCGAGGVVHAAPADGASDSAPVQNPVLLDSKSASKMVLRPVTPEYPAVAKMNYIQGPVRMQVTVSGEGKVQDASVVDGHPFLAASALKAIKSWLFRPSRRDNIRAGYRALVDVNFNLRMRKLRPMPPEPERDLERQIRPPEVVDLPSPPPGTPVVRLRVLVGADGEALDARPMSGSSVHYQFARRHVGEWKFRPARWGAMAVPWYLEVDVPVGGEPRGAADFGGQ